MSCGNFGNYEPSALRLYSENRLGLYSIIISVEMHILTSFLETYSMGYYTMNTILTMKTLNHGTRETQLRLKNLNAGLLDKTKSTG